MCMLILMTKVTVAWQRNKFNQIISTTQQAISIQFAAMEGHKFYFNPKPSVTFILINAI